MREVALQVVAIADPFSLKNVTDIKEALDVFFGIPVNVDALKKTVALLIDEDRIRIELGCYCLSDAEQKARIALVTQSRDLEKRVYEDWQREADAGGGLILVSFQVETKDPRPTGNTSQPLVVSR